VRGWWGEGGEKKGRGVWGKWGEMIQTLYAHMNKRNLKKLFTPLLRMYFVS
jgi:hypothetical protein